MHNQDKSISETTLQLLYDHYKDTFNRIIEQEKQRDYYLLFIFLAMLLAFFQASSPLSSQSVLSQILESKLNVKLSIEVSTFVGSVIWLGLLVLVIKYFQLVIQIDRQYLYHSKVEKQLGEYFERDLFKRESDAYKLGKPLFFRWVKLFYKIILPLSLIALVLWRGWIDITTINMSRLALSYNLLIALFIITSSLLYLKWIHFKQ